MNDNDHPILVAVDVETAGFSPIKDSFTELGSAMVRTDGKTLGTFSSLAKPKHSIPQNIVELTGINDKMVEGAEPPHIVVQKWIEWIGNRKVAIVGHNLYKFDIPMLVEPIRENRNVIIPNFFCIDTLIWVKKHIPYNGKGTHTLENLAKRIGVDPGNSHRALDDAKTTLSLVSYILKNFEKPKNIEELRKVLITNAKPIIQIVKN